MRLAFCLFRYFPFSGLAKDMLRIADCAHGRGHQVHIFTTEWRGEPGPNHKVELVPRSGLSNHGRVVNFHKALQHGLKGHEFDRVVGFNKVPGLDIYFAADACLAARARYTRHPLYRITPRYRAYHRFERSVFEPRSGCHNLVLSTRARDEYQEFYGTPDSRFTVLPPVIDPLYQDLHFADDARSRLRGELHVGESELMVIMVGSGFRTKGVDRAVRALGAMPVEFRNRVHLIVVGEGKPAAYAAFAAQLGVRDRVHFLGGRSDVPDLLHAADLLMHPAYNETAGKVLLEALAVGLPVLTTDVCGYAHHVERAGAGRVLRSPFSQSELNRQLLQLLAGDRGQWAKNAVDYVAQPLFFRMAENAVDAIEGTAQDGRDNPGETKDFFYLSDKFRSAAPPVPGFDDILSLSGEIYRRGPARRTLRFQRGGRAYFLKAHDGVGWREIFKNLVQLKLPVLGAGNEWHALHMLSRNGIKTPAPAGHGRRGRNPARCKSFIITEEVGNAISLEELVESNRSRLDDLGLKRTLIQSVADIARTLHHSGGNHRDFYLCHFLLHGGRTGCDMDIFLIDLHRAQIRAKTPMRWVVKDLGGLYYSAMGADLTRNDLFRFIKAYCGSPLRTALRSPVSWERVQKRADRLLRADQRSEP